MDIIGRKTIIQLPELGGKNVRAKIDTGAFRTAVHCESWALIEKEGKQLLEVTIQWEEGIPVVLHFEKFQKRTIKNSFGQTEDRYCVRTLILIHRKKIQSEISFTNRSGMRYPVLLGRKTIGKKFLVDVSLKS
ncbi:MAG: hypothetical protein RI989_696 [Bacteroidota bacterium]|jgi:hypothetical protein